MLSSQPVKHLQWNIIKMLTIIAFVQLQITVLCQNIPGMNHQSRASCRVNGDNMMGVNEIRRTVIKKLIVDLAVQV